MATEKFKALVHHVVSSCDDPNRLGAIRLNKILWFADSIAYRQQGASITGETYVKRQHGPVPKHILATLRELQDEGAILVSEKETVFGHKMRHFHSLKKPSDELFSPMEIQVVDILLKEICTNHTASSISDVSHDQVWDAANMGEEIPFFATFARFPGEIGNEAMSWADDVVNAAVPAT